MKGAWIACILAAMVAIFWWVSDGGESPSVKEKVLSSPPLEEPSSSSVPASGTPPSENLMTSSQKSIGSQRSSAADALSVSTSQENSESSDESHSRALSLQIAQIAQWVGCYQRDDCQLPEMNDPRAGEFYIAKQVQNHLQEMIKTAKEMHPQTLEDTAWNDAVRMGLSFPEGGVQMQALELVGTQTPQKEFLPQMLPLLTEGFDAKVAERVLQELARYSDASALIDDALIASIESGSFYVSQQVVKGILPFLSANNIAQFEALESRLDPQSQKGRDLGRQIEEYHRMQSGG